MADITIPCEGRGCKRQTRPCLDANTSPDGWSFTNTPGVERREWECDDPTQYHYKIEARKAPVKEESRE